MCVLHAYFECNTEALLLSYVMYGSRVWAISVLALILCLMTRWCLMMRGGA